MSFERIDPLSLLQLHEALQAREEGLDERERRLREEEAACGRLKADLLKEKARLEGRR